MRRGAASRRPRPALGAEDGARNTPSLLNVRLQHWFGWDGGNDSLWSQSIRPMLDAREMRADATHVARALRDDEELRRLYERAFGQAPPADDETAMVDAGKALAAFQETLASERTPFDDFRDALLRGDAAAAGRYPAAAQRGLRLFVGSGRASPAMRAEPQRRRVPPLADRVEAARRQPDDGRMHGLASLRTSAYARSGRFDDAPAARGRPWRRPSRRLSHAGLREVAVTAPYMHDGSIANLCDALRPHARSRRRRPAALTLAERRDLVALPAHLGVPGQVCWRRERAEVPLSGVPQAAADSSTAMIRQSAAWIRSDFSVANSAES
jgi:cytochrome c peroxidase